MTQSGSRTGKLSNKNEQHLAEDGGGQLVYLAPTRVNLQLAQERHPEITFRATREVSVYVEVEQAA